MEVTPNKLIIVVLLVLAIGGFLFYNQFSKELTIGEILGENPFTQGTEFSIQKNSNGKIVPLAISADKQNTLGIVFEDFRLIRTGELYAAIDADYIIAPKSHYSQKAYVFIEENVIVFSENLSNGYVIPNKDLTQSIKKILE